MTQTNADAVKDHRELLNLMLEVGEAAEKLEQLQHRLTAKLCSMAEHQGIQPDAIFFGASSRSCDLGR